ncbi:chemotaxis protein CheA [Leptospira idonii]|uniref:Chemotaxis protein CheA n=1 Tax=Leptospira idonii TaxID=1193500 RepID=A0A4V3JY78_9LEPT|nr:chemotaxis protein CheA [Leptospira idonii]TGN19976.1 chemotaxis protein CheA [Leptospira idonii]
MSREQLLLDFIPEAFDLIQDCETSILEIEELGDEEGSYNEDLINNLFRSVHTLKGSSGLLKLESIVKLTHEAETLLDILRKESLLPNTDTCQVLINTCDQLRKLFQRVDETRQNPEFDDESQAIVEVLKREIRNLKPEVAADSGFSRKNKPFEIFGEEIKKPKFEVFEDEPSSDSPGSKPYEIFGKEPEIKIVSPLQEPVPTEVKAVVANNTTAKQSSAVQKKEIKVANDKLDALMDLVGELVIAESNVTQHNLVKRVKNDDFNLSLTRLRKIVLDLQEVALSTRMIPISGVFQKMSRLVRDLQKKSMKKVVLQIEGEETEIDKSIVDLIADPIIHILRNSIDHGIESASEREELGKPEIGSIFLSARQSVNEVWIMIKDDGKGLDREKIIQKSIEKGVLTTDPSLLSDAEVYNLIFVPGLSTAKEITDISGRGVGMDIVKKNIEKLGGKIDIHSKPKKGTTFILRIPLSLGIMEGTVVRIGEKFFTVQTIELREFVSLRDKNPIFLEAGQKVIEVRGKFIPIFDINEVLNHREPLIYDNKDPLMLVIEYERKLLGIQVDEVVGNQNVVIKPLQGIMEEARGVNGFTILGNGNVSLILDVKSVFQKLHDTES